MTCRLFVEVGCFRDNANSWQLQADGRYERRRASDGQATVRLQEQLYQMALDAIKRAEQKRRTVFEPHQPASQERP